MKSYLKHLSLLDLHNEMKQARRELDYAKKELEQAQNRVIEIENQFSDFHLNHKAAMEVLKSTVKKSFSSQKRYDLFNTMLRVVEHGTVYRDRTNGNGVSVKVHLDRAATKKARKLADEVSVSWHSDPYNYDKKIRTERYIFRNVLGERKPTPCEVGNRLRFRKNHPYSSGSLKRATANWNKHLTKCERCKTYQSSLKSNVVQKELDAAAERCHRNPTK